MSSTRRAGSNTLASNTSQRLRARGPASSLPIGANCSSLFLIAASSAQKSSFSTPSELNMKLVWHLLAACLLFVPAIAQAATLRGQVTDESGAVVPGAKVVLSGPGKLSKTTTAGSDGSYSFADLPLGNYTVHATAPSLALRE